MSVKLHVLLILAADGDERSVSHSVLFTALPPGSSLRIRGWVDLTDCVNEAAKKSQEVRVKPHLGVGFEKCVSFKLNLCLLSREINGLKIHYAHVTGYYLAGR